MAKHFSVVPCTVIHISKINIITHYKKTVRRKDRKTERKKDRKTERQKDRKTERQKARKLES
jgi:hypothetical protein